MKHLFFSIHYLELGGAEASLLALLGALDYTKVQVDLFLHSHRGELMTMIPPPVNLLPEIPAYAQIERPFAEILKDGHLRIALARLLVKWQYYRYWKQTKPRDESAIFAYVARNITPVLPPINPDKEYDLAVSFLPPHDYVLQKVRARKKVAWIHTDYSRIDVNAALEEPVWAGYDTIVSISPSVGERFAKVFPSLKDRILEIPNILPVEWVRSRAEEIPPQVIAREMPAVTGTTNLLSIGRYSYAKNFDVIPEICRRLHRSGVPVRWYIIGYGDLEPLIRQRIAEAGMEEAVILLGKKANPYPYIKACDMYVQPSRYEGSPVTIREAIALGKPVIATAFPTVQSAVRDGVDGIIVPMDQDGCARGIARFIRDGGAAFRPALGRIEQENSAALRQFYKLL